MMTNKMLSRRFWALMRRNFIYRKRNWMATVGEIALPLLMCYLLVSLKKSATKSGHFKPRTVQANIPSDLQAVQIFSFTDYVTALQAKRICLNKTKANHNSQIPVPGHVSNYTFEISGMPENSRNWQVPFIQCDSRSCQYHGEEAYQYCHYPKLGLAANDDGGLERARTFRDYVYNRYPQLTNTTLPAFQSGEFVKIFESNQALEAYIQHADYGFEVGHPKLAIAVVFTGNDKENYIYSLRVNATNNNAPGWSNGITRTTPDTNRLFASFAKREIDACGHMVRGQPQGPLQFTCTGQYILNGLLTVQRFLHDWIMVDTGAHDKGLFVAEHGVKFIPFPSKSYSEEGFYTVLKDFLPLVLTLGFLYPSASMISYIAQERELGQKEFLKIMSTREWEIGTSWFCSFFSLQFVTATLLARVSSSLFEYSDPVILWLFWQSTCLAFTVFSSTIPSMIGWLAKTASRTVIIGLLIFLVGYIMSQSVDLEEGGPLVLRFLCLHPVAAFGFGIQEIGRLEDAGVGATWHSFHQTDSPSRFTVRTALFFLIFDSLLGTLLSWYFNRVIPGSEGGSSLPWSFPFQWLHSSSQDQYSKAGENSIFRCEAAKIDQDIPVEPVSDSLKSQAERGSSVEIHNLRKVFKSKVGDPIVALDGLNLSLHQGQVTALLGHNGGGKSTIINLLIGAMLPSGGACVVAGKHILTQLAEIRQNLGICLQHNDCLFLMLTVRETVRLFLQLKSRDDDRVDEGTINWALREVSLQDKADSLVMNLSGGQKRKLCVAIGFCGDSQVVILDEPTTGMDPYSRRAIWNLIKRKRQGRIILLTTHFLDEAEILADKIAILKDGRLQCVGSSLFLKRAFDCGCRLSIEKAGANTNDNNSRLLTSMNESLDQRLGAIIKDTLGNVVEITSSTGNEMSVHVPLEATSKLSTLLGDLDQEKRRGSISSFGLSMTTLNEVFQKTTTVAGETSSLSDETCYETKSIATSQNANRDLDSFLHDPMKLYRSQMTALLRKRQKMFLRDKKAWFCTTMIPGLFVLVGFLALKYAASDRALEPLKLDLADYNAGLEPGDEHTNRVHFNKMGHEFKCQPGWCAYQAPIVQERESKDLYFYCGAQSYLITKPNCTQDISDKIMERLRSDGVAPIGGTARNLNESSRSLLEGADMFASSLYGALYWTHGPNSTVAPGIRYDMKVSNQCHMRKGRYLRDEECDLYAGLGYVVSTNFTALHASPLFQKLADEAIVREALLSNQFHITPTIHPMPATSMESRFRQEEDVFNLWFMVVLSFPFISGYVANLIVEERQSKAKHLQRIAGADPIVYWFSNFLWDNINYQIPLWFTVMLMCVLKVDVFITNEHDTFEGVVLLLLLYGPAATAFAYLLSFGFFSGSLCNMFLIVMGFCTGLVGPIASFTLRLIGTDPENPWEKLLHVATIVEWVGLLFPSFCMGKGLFYTMNIATIEMRSAAKLSVFHPSILLHEVIALPLQTVAYLFLVICLDRVPCSGTIASARRLLHPFLRFHKAEYEECETEEVQNDDDDVVLEEERIRSEVAHDDVVVIQNMSKVFSNGNVAVRNLTLGIPSGQCFGLLGSNGAGKTTTLSILTSEALPTSGRVLFNDKDISQNSDRSNIAFCPQFDAIFEGLTGREQVEFYGAIKGIPAIHLREKADQMLSNVGICPRDRDRLGYYYSGGQKRKLMMASALMGYPGILFCDEVSSGVDPVSRQEIWKVISALTKAKNVETSKQNVVVLTTHSMEECEALCSRIGIMSKGRLLCVGSAQSLKSKYGQGYQVELKIKHVSERDVDFAVACERLIFHYRSKFDADTETAMDNISFDLEQTHAALVSITGDDSLSSMLRKENCEAASIFHEANSENGIGLPALAAFVTLQLRLQRLERFVLATWNGILRERQDTCARYEISSSEFTASDIFSTIEANKDSLWLSEYSVNQTSLEQVFNTLISDDEGELK